MLVFPQFLTPNTSDYISIRVLTVYVLSHIQHYEKINVLCIFVYQFSITLFVLVLKG